MHHSHRWAHIFKPALTTRAASVQKPIVEIITNTENHPGTWQGQSKLTCIFFLGDKEFLDVLQAIYNG